MNELVTVVGPNGALRINKQLVSKDAPCVVMCCGHNGFYHFAFFPILQSELANAGISSVAFNYSHNGISGDGDYFDELEKYQRNCRALEVADTLFVLKYLRNDGVISAHAPLFVFGHSMGGITATFATRLALQEGIAIHGLSLLCSMKTLNVRTPEVMQEWREKGVYYRYNSRTKQDLPQGFYFLKETEAHATDWNMQNAISALQIPIFIAHAVNDESVPFEHGRSLFQWCLPLNKATTFLPIPQANHTLNTSHLGNRTSGELLFYCTNLVNWLQQIPK